MSYFQFPPEIRNTIYALVLRRDFQIPILPPDQERESLCDRLTQRMGPRNIYTRNPSYNALSLTCRLAYRESIQVYYEQNHFETYTGQAFQDYVNGVPEERLGMIQVLNIRIQRVTNGLDTSPRVSGRYMSPRSCRWTLRHPYFLDPFRNLKVLQLQGCFRLSLNATIYPKARHLERLVAISSRLPQLIQICIQTLVPHAYIHDYNFFEVEIQGTPHWEYDVETFCPCSDRLLPRATDSNVIEYLTREDASERVIHNL